MYIINYVLCPSPVVEDTGFINVYMRILKTPKGIY